MCWRRYGSLDVQIRQGRPFKQPLGRPPASTTRYGMSLRAIWATLSTFLAVRRASRTLFMSGMTGIKTILAAQGKTLLVHPASSIDNYHVMVCGPLINMCDDGVLVDFGADRDICPVSCSMPGHERGVRSASTQATR